MSASIIAKTLVPFVVAGIGYITGWVLWHALRRTFTLRCPYCRTTPGYTCGGDIGPCMWPAVEPIEVCRCRCGCDVLG